MGNGYPPGALRRVQGMELDVLKATALVCEKLGLRWFMDGGTCLGAVRHGGFIPWDDDIDIGMPIEDYRVFCAQAPALLPREFGLYTHGATDNYPPLFAKVYRKNTRFMSQQMVDAGFEEGIFVDVFAYARLDSRKSKRARQIRNAALWQRMSYLYYTAHPKLPASAPCKPLLRAACVAAHGIVRALFTPESIERRFERVFADGDEQGPWCNIFYPTWGTFETDELFPTQMLAFEDAMVPAPHDPHAFLSKMYGDYMTPPPEEERVGFPPLILDFGDGVNVMEQ